MFFTKKRLVLFLVLAISYIAICFSAEYLIGIYQIQGVKSKLNDENLSDTTKVRLLISSLETENAFLQQFAHSEILKVPREDKELAYDEFLRLAQSEDSNVKTAAIHALGEIGNEIEELDRVVEWTRHPDPNVRSNAAWAIGNIWQGDPETTAIVTGMLEDNNEMVLALVLLTLSKYSELSEEALSKIASLENHSNEYISLYAGYIRELHLIEETGNIIHLGMVDHQDWDFRLVAYYNLVPLKLQRPEILDAYIRGLEDSNYLVRELAANGIEQFGEEGSSALPKLISLLRDENKDVVIAVINAINSMEVSRKKALPNLKEIANSQDKEVRNLAIKVIDEIESAES